MNSDLEEFFDSFPTLTFDMDGGYKYLWEPKDYLFIDDPNQMDVYCLPLYQLSGRVILGGVWMKNHDILFDRQSRTIGIVKSLCSPSLINNKSADDLNSTKKPVP